MRGMDDTQIGELWDKNYPKRLSDPMAQQVCRLICHLIHTIAANDAGPDTSLQKLRKVLTSMNIPEKEYDNVMMGN